MAHHFSQSLLYICSITRKLFLPIANKQYRPLFKPPDSPPCLPQECLAPRTSVLPPNKPVPRVNDHHLPRPQAGHLRFSFTPCPKYIQYSIPSGSLCLRSALSSPTFTSPWIAMGSTWSLHHPWPPPRLLPSRLLWVESMLQRQPSVLGSSKLWSQTEWIHVPAPLFSDNRASYLTFWTSVFPPWK